MDSSYDKVLDYLFQRLPMYQRLGKKAMKLDLNRIRAFCKELGDPQDRIDTIHIAGTNGKGSVAHLLAAILQAAGKRVGLYTSPHFIDYRERIKINGRFIPKQEVTAFMEKYNELIMDIQPTFFEATVAMAFHYFAMENIDVGIIETGLGGRLDSTNIITPLLSVITNVHYDHMDVLGKTLPEIAFEKAGIIKEGVPVVVGSATGEIRNVFNSIAAKNGCAIVYAEDRYSVTNLRYEEEYNIIDVVTSERPAIRDLKTDLLGLYQKENIATVLAATDMLNELLGFDLTDQHIAEGLENVKEKTEYVGRWQVLDVAPLMIADSGHNEAGMSEIVQHLNTLNYERLHLIIGFVKEKDIRPLLKTLPKIAQYYWVKPPLPRGLPAEETASCAAELGLEGRIYPSIQEAIDAAQKHATAEDVIFIGGSTYVVAEALALEG